MDNETLAQLQDLILDRVLTSTPLPGQGSSISFPDLAYVTQAEEKLVLDDGYLGETSHAIVVGQEELDRRLAEGQTGFLRFEPPLEEPGKVTLRLRVLLGFPDVDTLPLGELVVTFAQRDEEWTTVPPTHAVAF